MSRFKKLIETHWLELISLTVILFALMGFKTFLSVWSPQTAQYDLFSEVETIVWTICKSIIYFLAAWFMLFITLPKLHSRLFNFYHNIDRECNPDERKSLAMKAFFSLLFTLLFIHAFGSAPRLNGYQPSDRFACHSELVSESPISQASACDQLITEPQLRSQLIDTLQSTTHVREIGWNTSPEIDMYLESVGIAPGHAWCAAYTSYHLTLFDVPNPNNAWSPAWARQSDRIIDQTMRKNGTVKMEAQPGDCFTIWYNHLNRVGHVGFITDEDHRYYHTIEGNTNIDGSRHGIGVFARKRDKNKVYAVTNYITPYFEENEKYIYSLDGSKPSDCFDNDNSIDYSTDQLQNNTHSHVRTYRDIRYNHNGDFDTGTGHNSNSEVSTSRFGVIVGIIAGTGLDGSNPSDWEETGLYRSKRSDRADLHPNNSTRNNISTDQGWLSIHDGILRFAGNSTDTQRQHYNHPDRTLGSPAEKYTRNSNQTANTRFHEVPVMDRYYSHYLHSGYVDTQASKNHFLKV